MFWGVLSYHPFKTWIACFQKIRPLASKFLVLKQNENFDFDFELENNQISRFAIFWLQRTAKIKPRRLALILYFYCNFDGQTWIYTILRNLSVSQFRTFSSYKVITGIRVKIYLFWHKRSALATGNDVSGHYFHHSFLPTILFPRFSSVATFSDRSIVAIGRYPGI